MQVDNTLYPINESDLVRYCKGDYNLRARATGEVRAPKKGEWYLSGSVVEAFRSFSDYTVECHICQLIDSRTGDIANLAD